MSQVFTQNPLTEGNLFFLDPVNGSDGNDGLADTHPIKTVAAARSRLTSNGDGLVIFPGLREKISWSGLNQLQIFLRDRTVPCSRGDNTIPGPWINVSGNLWKSAAFTPTMLGVAAVFVDPDTVVNAWLGRPVFLDPVASLALVTSTDNSYWVGDDTAGGDPVNRVYAHFHNAVDPNGLIDGFAAPHIYYAERWVSGPEISGISITGDYNYAEMFPAWWLESGGSGKGGWSGILFGDHCTLRYFGGGPWGYKLGAIVGDYAKILCEPNSVFSGFSNSATAGALDNGTGAFTIQGIAGGDSHSGIIDYLNARFDLASWLSRKTANPMEMLGKPMGVIISHGVGHTIGGQLTTGGVFKNRFGQSFLYDYVDNDAAPTDVLDPQTYGYLRRQGAITDAISLGGLVLHAAYLNNDMRFATFANDGSLFFTSTGNIDNKLLLMGGLILLPMAGGGQFVWLSAAGAETRAVNMTLINNSALDSNMGVFKEGGRIYMRGCLCYALPNNNINNKRVILGAPNMADVDIEYCTFIGFGRFTDALGNIAGLNATTPVMVNSAGVIDPAGTNRFYGDIAPGAATFPFTDWNAGNYRPTHDAITGILSPRFITPHTPTGLDGEAYSGVDGCYQSPHEHCRPWRPDRPDRPDRF